MVATHKKQTEIIRIFIDPRDLNIALNQPCYALWSPQEIQLSAHKGEKLRDGGQHHLIRPPGGTKETHGTGSSAAEAHLLKHYAQRTPRCKAYQTQRPRHSALAHHEQRHGQCSCSVCNSSKPSTETALATLPFSQTSWNEMVIKCIKWIIS